MAMARPTQGLSSSVAFVTHANYSRLFLMWCNMYAPLPARGASLTQDRGHSGALSLPGPLKDCSKGFTVYFERQATCCSEGFVAMGSLKKLSAQRTDLRERLSHAATYINLPERPIASKAEWLDDTRMICVLVLGATGGFCLRSLDFRFPSRRYAKMGAFASCSQGGFMKLVFQLGKQSRRNDAAAVFLIPH